MNKRKKRKDMDRYCLLCVVYKLLFVMYIIAVLFMLLSTIVKQQETKEFLVHKVEVVPQPIIEPIPSPIPELIPKFISYENESEESNSYESESEEPNSYESELKVPNPYEVEILSHLIYGEAGDQSRECMLAVGAVVLNRVKHERYPDTLEGVIFDPGQYACTEDGNFEKTPSEQAYQVAFWLLENELKETPIKVLPDNVIYQSQFEQGDGKYQRIGTEIFCYEGEKPSREGFLL